MKTNFLPVLVAAGLTASPLVLWAQTPTASPTPTPAPNSGSTSTAATPQTPVTPATPSNADISQGAREQFSELDVNKDNQISPEEFTRFSQVDPNPARDASSSTGIGRNGTGPGTAGSTTGSTGGVTGKNNDAEREKGTAKSAGERFVILDINNDGNLSLEEFARANPVKPEQGRDASSSTGAGRNGTGGGTAGSTTGSTEGSTENLNGNEKR